MSDKVYPDVDPREFPREYNRHIAAMTDEDLHGKGDIAIQLAWRDVAIAEAKATITDMANSAIGSARKLAAKDAEIGSLLSQLAELRSSLADYKTRVEKLAESLADRYGERDEARECVKRLYPLAQASVDRLRYESSLPMSASLEKQVCAELEEARAALDAVPEHLRP